MKVTETKPVNSISLTLQRHKFFLAWRKQNRQPSQCSYHWRISKYHWWRHRLPHF